MSSDLVAPSKLTKSPSVKGTQVKSGRISMSAGQASAQVALAKEGKSAKTNK